MLRETEKGREEKRDKERKSGCFRASEIERQGERASERETERERYKERRERACVCLCISLSLSLSLSLSVRAHYAYVLSRLPPTHAVVPGFPQHKTACVYYQALPASPASPAASAKRLTDIPRLQKIAVRDTHLFFLPYPLKALRAPHYIT